MGTSALSFTAAPDRSSVIDPGDSALIADGLAAATGGERVATMPSMQGKPLPARRCPRASQAADRLLPAGQRCPTGWTRRNWDDPRFRRDADRAPTGRVSRPGRGMVKPSRGRRCSRRVHIPLHRRRRRRRRDRVGVDRGSSSPRTSPATLLRRIGEDAGSGHARRDSNRRVYLLDRPRVPGGRLDFIIYAFDVFLFGPAHHAVEYAAATFPRPAGVGALVHAPNLAAPACWEMFAEQATASRTGGSSRRTIARARRAPT